MIQSYISSYKTESAAGRPKTSDIYNYPTSKNIK